MPLADHLEWAAPIVLPILLDEIARILLVMMPFLLAANTLALGWVAWVLSSQESKYEFGKHSTRLFHRLTGVGISLTIMFARLAWVFHDAPLAPWLAFMIPLEVFLILAAISGVNMARTEKDLP